MDRRTVLQGLAVAGGALLVPPALASVATSKRIPIAYREAASKHNVPAKHLFALAVKESREPALAMPNPFAMNFKGKSFFFKSQQELYVNAKYLLDNGQRVFDVGPVQVNWKWHHMKFEDLWDATNPEKSLDVGTAYYAEQYRKCGDWFVAAGMYHSFTKSKAARYERDYRRIYHDLNFA